MNLEKLNAWPRLHAHMKTSEGSYTATLKISSGTLPCVANTENELRAGLIAIAASHARQLNRPIALDVIDVSGEYQLGVRPEGIVHAVSQQMTIPPAAGLLPVEAPCRACRELASAADDQCSSCGVREPLSVLHDLPAEPAVTTPPAEEHVTGVPTPPQDHPAPQPVQHMSVPHPLPLGAFKTMPETSATPTIPTPALQEDELEHTMIDDRTIVMAPKPKHTISVQLETGECLNVCTPVVLGRRPQNIPGHDVITLESPQRKISRSHATIDLSDLGELTVTDLASTNGVFVNGAQIAPEQPTSASTAVKIEIGDTVLTVEVIGTGRNGETPGEELLVEL